MFKSDRWRASIERAMQRAWGWRGPLAWMLWPASLVYGVLVSGRRWLYRKGALTATRLDAVVVIVGNVVAGGAGKTPATIALVQHCEEHGWQVGVVSRGHGRSDTGCKEVFAGSEPEAVGDEPALIKRKTDVPLFVGTDRVQAARALLAAYPSVQVIVCDDGLQHYALHRDVEVCMIDDFGIGNGMLLPAGPLREPWPRTPHGSSHGDPQQPTLLLHSGDRPAPGMFRGTRKLATHGIRSDGSRMALQDLVDLPLIAVAAIAHPTRFFSMLQKSGMVLSRTFALPDHHDFADWSRPVEGSVTVLCTEKDADKLWRWEPDAIAVPLIFTPEPNFFLALDERISRRLQARLSSNDGRTPA